MFKAIRKQDFDEQPITALSGVSDLKLYLQGRLLLHEIPGKRVGNDSTCFQYGKFLFFHQVPLQEATELLGEIKMTGYVLLLVKEEVNV